MTTADDKRAAAEAAVAEVEAGMLVGLGSGSTVAFAIAALGRRVAEGLRIDAVSTSLATERAARAAGIPTRDFADVAAIDLAIDGVDEIDPRFRAIKGAGGALLREKIVAAAARRMIAIADASKPVAQLGHAALPVEILPFARGFVEARVRALGGVPMLRRDAAGQPFATDQDNHILDCAFGPIADPEGLATTLATIPGMLGHGLFLAEIDLLIVAGGGRVERRVRPPDG
jgi:ribose 5-phosphate isomerase A